MVRLSERLRRRRPPVLAALPAQENPDPDPAEPAGIEGSPSPRRELSRELPVGELAHEEHPVSGLLYDRLGEVDIVLARELAAEIPDFPDLDTADPDLGRMLTLHSALWHRLESVTERTGLVPDQPPDDVHAMARGPLAAAGGLYEADLVADAIRSAGSDIASAGRALDFGCSSGRVVRVLAAAYPQVRWLGCDPNHRAIAWAQQNLPRVDFFASGNEPRLVLEQGSIGLAFAISIWSHFEPHLGLQWFEEMRRLLRPGGHLMMTTHGLSSIGHYADNGLRTPEQCEEIAEALYQRGWWYAPEFGQAGDWGVVNPGWGTAFLTPEWLLTHLCPQWRVVEFAPGRNAGNQDVYVLQRP